VLVEVGARLRISQPSVLHERAGAILRALRPYRGSLEWVGTFVDITVMLSATDTSSAVQRWWQDVDPVLHATGVLPTAATYWRVPAAVSAHDPAAEAL